MIENTNLKNDMAHPFSRRNMIMPPASVEQAMDAEGIVEGSVVTIDGEKYTDPTLDLETVTQNVTIPLSLEMSYNKIGSCFIEDNGVIFFTARDSNVFGYLDANGVSHCYHSKLNQNFGIGKFGDKLYIFGAAYSGNYIDEYEIYSISDLSTREKSVSLGVLTLDNGIMCFTYNNENYIITIGSSSNLLYKVTESGVTDVTFTWPTASGNKLLRDPFYYDGKIYGCTANVVNVIDMSTLTAEQYTGSAASDIFNFGTTLYVDGDNIGILSRKDTAPSRAYIFNTTDHTYTQAATGPQHSWVGVVKKIGDKYIAAFNFTHTSNSSGKVDHATVDFSDGNLVSIITTSSGELVNVVRSYFIEVEDQ